MIEPPYVRNLYQAMSIMYPVVKGNAGFGGEISNRSTKHLLVEFNCLGIEGTQDVEIAIESKFQKYDPILLNFRKECSTSNKLVCNSYIETIFSGLT